MKQTRLTETKREKRDSPQYICVNCHVEYGDEEKYAVAVRNGRLGIVLEPVCLTLFQCPKCGAQHYSKEFKDEKAAEKLLKRKREKRVEHLKRLYA